MSGDGLESVYIFEVGCLIKLWNAKKEAKKIIARMFNNELDAYLKRFAEVQPSLVL